MLSSEESVHRIIELDKIQWPLIGFRGHESEFMLRPCYRRLSMLRQPSENPLIAIVGATGTGKSEVSLS